MKINLNAHIFAIAVLTCLYGLGMQSINAAENTQVILDQIEVRPLDSVQEIFSGKNGGDTPSPPADPYCPNGSVGPISDQTISKPCKTNGKDGTKMCHVKWVDCYSGPGEQDYATTESCGRCVALPRNSQGQVESLSGN